MNERRQKAKMICDDNRETIRSDEELLYPGERFDDLQRNHYKIIQNPKNFCFGIDAVLLSAFTKVKKGETAIDLGTGNGILPILLEAKTQGKHFTGLEIQEEIFSMAVRSVKANHLEAKIDIVCGDIKEASSLFKPSSFQVVTSNPPYMNVHHGLKNPRLPKAIARHEILCTLEDVIREASKLLEVNGRFYIVHRPFRLVELFHLMTTYQLEPKTLQMVHPYINKEPTMVLVEGRKGGAPMITTLPPIVVYEAKGTYRPEIYELYGF